MFYMKPGNSSFFSVHGEIQLPRFKPLSLPHVQLGITESKRATSVLILLHCPSRFQREQGRGILPQEALSGLSGAPGCQKFMLRPGAGMR
jgi:hypothetical protein